MALSLSINTILTLSIIGQLFYLRRQLSLLNQKDIYISLVTLIVESASPYTIIALMTVIACGLSSPMQYILLPILGQLQVPRCLFMLIWTCAAHILLQAIPPLLIANRVAAGRAVSASTCSSVVQQRPASLHEGRKKQLDTLQFRPRDSESLSYPSKSYSSRMAIHIDTSVMTDGMATTSLGFIQYPSSTSASSETSLWHNHEDWLVYEPLAVPEKVQSISPC
jgi:hypothetical protein